MFLSTDNSELMRLNKAVYEAWYFHKEEQAEQLKRERQEKELQDKTKKPRKVSTERIPKAKPIITETHFMLLFVIVA